MNDDGYSYTTCVTRRCRISDLLTEELGYVVSEDEMKSRLEIACADARHAVFVAVSDSVVGWIQVVRDLTLESGYSGELRGFVVAKSHRRLGIGRKLVGAAESWAQDHQCDRMRVRTNVIRNDARAFYLKLGYALSKTQNVFDKSL